MLAIIYLKNGEIGERGHDGERGIGERGMILDRRHQNKNPICDSQQGIRSTIEVNTKSTGDPPQATETPSKLLLILHA